MDYNKKTYIGLTIGPIVETINNSKETGELWASSYLFSYIMKKIIKTLINKDNTLKDKFIVPYINDKNIFKEGNEVGLFHDRFIFESRVGDFKLVKESVEKVKGDIIKEIYNYKKSDCNEIKQNIDDFLKIYYLEVTVDLDGKKDENNIIFKVNACLDALELREKLPSEEGVRTNYLFDILSNECLKKDNFKKHFLSKDAYGKKDKKGGYPSLLKIALSKIYQDDFPCDDDEVWKMILDKKFKKGLIKAQEYVAVVQVDGDFMGKTIRKFEINKDNKDIYKDYKEFSKKLLNYSKKAHQVIKEYGGFTIYAGGDDLLFIAPIINKYIKTKKQYSNIFNLVDKLSEIFNDEFKENKCDKDKPTTSFGVAIVHYKFPLYYALDEARNLLFNKAKNYKFKDKEKNAIAFKVIKSSGQSFETVVGKESESYKHFRELFNYVNNSVKSKDKSRKIKNYLKAIHFKLKKDKVILNEIGEDKKLLENYFCNNFDEKIHKTEPIKTYINKLIDFMWPIYKEMKTDKDRCINQIYTYLRFIRFMDEDINLEMVEERKKVIE